MTVTKDSTMTDIPFLDEDYWTSIETLPDRVVRFMDWRMAMTDSDPVSQMRGGVSYFPPLYAESIEE